MKVILLGPIFTSIHMFTTNPLLYECKIKSYRVSDTFIVAPEDIWISYDLGRPMVTMFACHPKGSARQRIVVQAELLAGRRVA